MRVEAGEMLMRIWNDDLAAQVSLAESEVSTARARLREVCLRADVAEREAERLRALGGRGVVSEEDVDRSSTNAEAELAACEAARANLQVALARVASAQAAVARTVLIAPFAGVVAEVNAELGEFVTPSPPGIPTPPAIDLIDDRCLYVSAPIDEVDAPRIAPGMPVCVTLDAFPEPFCGATVRRVAPYVLDLEKHARTVSVEVDLEQRAEGPPLLPGYSADVEIELERRADVLRIPTEAILEGNRVLVLGPDGILAEREIVPGLANWRYTEIAGGLEPGERVVVSVGRSGVEAGAPAVPEDAPEPR
jgi:HlyD family secretion protein